MASAWDTDHPSGMVSIGTHSLFLSASGPDRKPGQPVVLLMQGLGSTIAEWVAVRRLVTPFARRVAYDRSGLGQSESPLEPPEAITAVSVATELDALLKSAGIGPPYIIVCHSWGGITAREFLHLRRDDVVGMVFVDANTERTFEDTNWPPPWLGAVTGDVDWNERTGLSASHKLSEEEWAAVINSQQDPRNQRTVAAESRGYQGDRAILAAKQQFETQPLRDRPVSVIRGNTPRDFRRMYDAGVAAGNGTEEERRLFREYLEDWDGRDHAYQHELLKLSSYGRYSRTSTSGHNIHMEEPELVAKEVRWVWDHAM
ncbi:Uncharacterized protein LSUE1_G009505, partial [Lachnellula suecica]